MTPVAVEDLDVAALRRVLAHGDGQRHALDLEAGHADVHELPAVRRSLYCDADVLRRSARRPPSRPSLGAQFDQLPHAAVVVLPPARR